MPVPGKLSRRLYETLGEEAAAAMVDWMHHMDAQRAELRELNELNFSRFDAKLAQRVVELDGKIDRVAARLDGKIDRVAAGLHGKIDRVAAELRETLERGLKEQTRWLFLAWATLLIAIIGL